jgi:hypothetical protein
MGWRLGRSINGSILVLHSDGREEHGMGYGMHGYPVEMSFGNVGIDIWIHWGSPVCKLQGLERDSRCYSRMISKVGY